MTVPEILRGAAAEVRNGWTRGVRQDALGNVCVLGALDRAAGLHGLGHYALALREVVPIRVPDVIECQRPEVVTALARAIDPNVKGDVYWHSHFIAQWNNAFARTAADVAFMLEFAALCAEQEAVGSGGGGDAGRSGGLAAIDPGTG